jgi:hypothetical protein
MVFIPLKIPGLPGKLIPLRLLQTWLPRSIILSSKMHVKQKTFHEFVLLGFTRLADPVVGGVSGPTFRRSIPCHVTFRNYLGKSPRHFDWLTGKGERYDSCSYWYRCSGMEWIVVHMGAGVRCYRVGGLEQRPTCESNGCPSSAELWLELDAGVTARGASNSIGILVSIGINALRA